MPLHEGEDEVVWDKSAPPHDALHLQAQFGLGLQFVP